MKATCPKCNTAFEVKTLASLGGKARWKGIPASERSKIARAAVSARWAKQKQAKEERS
jgi:hypothetical protein